MGCTFKPDLTENSAISFAKSSKSIKSAPHKSVTESSKKEMTKKEEAELLDYLLGIGKQKTGLHDKTHPIRPPFEYNDSFNINHPELKNGQRLFLNNLCQVYSVYPLKKSKQTQYLNLLERQKALGDYQNYQNNF